jgi:hypothetical protein
LNVVEVSVNGAAGAAASLMPQLASTTAPAASSVFFIDVLLVGCDLPPAGRFAGNSHAL